MNKVLESNLLNYINKLYETENIEIDIRFAYYGDKNEFYGKDGSHFVRCEHYHVKDLSEVEKLIKYAYIVRLCQQVKPEEKVALYIHDIVNVGDGYNVIVGGRLFK